MFGASKSCFGKKYKDLEAFQTEIKHALYILIDIV